jgi:hypothetical protein
MAWLIAFCILLVSGFVGLLIKDPNQQKIFMKGWVIAIVILGLIIPLIFFGVMALSWSLYLRSLPDPTQQKLDELKAVARSGDIEAQHAYGTRTLRTDPQSIFWICSAAHSNHRLAQSTMGYLHRLPEEDPSRAPYFPVHNNKKSLMWYLLAIENGFNHATTYRDELKAKMSELEVAGAIAMAEEWSPNPEECVP